MSDKERSVEEVAAQCINCQLKNVDVCNCCDEEPVTQCIPSIVPTDDELALLADAIEEVLLGIRDRIKKSAIAWNGLDHPFPANDGIIERDDIYINMPSIGYMIRPHDGHPIEMPIVAPPAPGVQQPLLTSREWEEQHSNDD